MSPNTNGKYAADERNSSPTPRIPKKHIPIDFFDINYNVAFRLSRRWSIRKITNVYVITKSNWSATPHRNAEITEFKKETQSDTRMLQNRAPFHFLAPLTYQNDEKKEREREKKSWENTQFVSSADVFLFCRRANLQHIRDPTDQLSERKIERESADKEEERKGCFTTP